MRWFYLLAGVLALFTCAVHAVVGGIDTLNPLMATNLPLEVRATTMTVWHATTVLLLMSGLAFFWAFAHHERARPLGIFLGLYHLIFAALFAFLSYQWFENLVALPQWTLLAPIALFALLAA